MTAPVEYRSNHELLSELCAEVLDVPRRRLHVHPESAMWISIAVQNMGLSPHVQVVRDPDCREAGRGWVETLTVEQWQTMRALVGERVRVKASWPEMLAGAWLQGALLALDHGEAQLDLGGGDIRYLQWIEVTPAP